MYIPAHFAADPAGVPAFVDLAGAADLVTFDGSQLSATLLPVIWDRPDDPAEGAGRLLGHLALANPQWRSAQAGVPALAIVHGPQAYISPSWYQSTAEHGRTVPTWNYTAVHFTGPVTFHEDAAWLRDIVTRLTQRYEDHRSRPWRITDAPAAYVEGQLRGIVGVELTITQVEAKEKLSQNRSRADRDGVIAALRESGEPGAEGIATLMTAKDSAG